MKLKLKHLRSILTTANVTTTTCKEKRDLVDLVLKNRFKFQQSQNQHQQQQQQSQSNRRTPTPPTQQQQQQQQNNSNSFNDTFSSFMNNVQDFVNFNLNSALNQAQPAPPPPPPSHSSSTSSSNINNNNNNKNTFTQSTSSNFNIPHGSSSSSSSSSSTTSNSANTQMPSSNSSTSNLNSLFNLIGEQVQNVANNHFSFNNVFTNLNPAETDTQRRSSTSSNSSNYSAATPTPQPSQPAPPPPPPPPTPAQHHSDQPAEAPAPIKRRASLSDIKSVSDIENLSIKQIKEILAVNFVDYKGCCEKKELIEKAKRLYNSYEDNKRLEKELNNNETNEMHNAAGSGAASDGSSASSADPHAQTGKKANVDENDLCKICMETLIDCVLLDCGHMVSCTKCGKRLAECPICENLFIYLS